MKPVVKITASIFIVCLMAFILLVGVQNVLKGGLFKTGNEDIYKESGCSSDDIADKGATYSFRKDPISGEAGSFLSRFTDTVSGISFLADSLSTQENAGGIVNTFANRKDQGSLIIALSKLKKECLMEGGITSISKVDKATALDFLGGVFTDESSLQNSAERATALMRPIFGNDIVVYGYKREASNVKTQTAQGVVFYGTVISIDTNKGRYVYTSGVTIEKGYMLAVFFLINEKDLIDEGSGNSEFEYSKALEGIINVLDIKFN